MRIRFSLRNSFTCRTRRQGSVPPVTFATLVFFETVARTPGMGILPRRGRTYQPRATPWDGKSNRHQALKGRDTGTAMLRPFRAQVSTSDPIPGRCPGRIGSCPCGATANDAGIDATVSFFCIFSRCGPPRTASSGRGQYSECGGLTTRGARERLLTDHTTGKRRLCSFLRGVGTRELRLGSPRLRAAWPGRLHAVALTKPWADP